MITAHNQVLLEVQKINQTDNETNTIEYSQIIYALAFIKKKEI